MPIDTAVTATAVDSASAAVVISSTNAMERCLVADVWALACSKAPRRLKSLDMSNLRESVSEFVQ